MPFGWGYRYMPSGRRYRDRPYEGEYRDMPSGGVCLPAFTEPNITIRTKNISIFPFAFGSETITSYSILYSLGNTLKV